MSSTDSSDSSSPNGTPQHSPFADDSNNESSVDPIHLAKLDGPSSASDLPTDYSPNSTSRHSATQSFIPSSFQFDQEAELLNTQLNSPQVSTPSTELDVQMLNRQLYSHHIKLPKRPILRLLESMKVDINIYYQPENLIKINKSNVSPRHLRANTQHNPTTPRAHMECPSQSQGGGEGKIIKGGVHPAPNQNEEPMLTSTRTPEQSSFIMNGFEEYPGVDPIFKTEISGGQKEDSLTWCYQQIKIVNEMEEKDQPVYFHQAILADSAPSTMYPGLSHFRDPDRVTSPDELDEILCLLTCAGKFFVTELLALAQSIEQVENHKNQTSPTSMSKYTLFLNSPRGMLTNKTKNKIKKKNLPSHTYRILSSRHICDAHRKMNNDL